MLDILAQRKPSKQKEFLKLIAQEKLILDSHVDYEEPFLCTRKNY
jgi:hypothetical protein